MQDLGLPFGNQFMPLIVLHNFGLFMLYTFMCDKLI